MLRYEKTTTRDSEQRLWYGVAAVNDETAIEQWDGLTTDGESVEQLVEYMNSGQASLIHFAEIIEDFVAQCSMV